MFVLVVVSSQVKVKLESNQIPVPVQLVDDVGAGLMVLTGTIMNARSGPHVDVC